jgi:RNA recognition motif-containing protein
MNLFVTNLARSVTADDLKWLFSRCGPVLEVSIWVDSEDKSLRFAAIQMQSYKHAKRARRELNGERFKERILWVDKAPDEFSILRRACAKASTNPNTRRSGPIL